MSDKAPMSDKTSMSDAAAPFVTPADASATSEFVALDSHFVDSDPESAPEPAPGRPYRAGFVAVVGRPNVGKSTLFNALLGQKVSITTPRPQTTRQAILGIHTTPEAQIILVDTPGIHQKATKKINKTMNRIAVGALLQADIVVLILESNRLTEEDDIVIEHLRDTGSPVLLVLNKIDLLADKSALLPLIDTVRQKLSFVDILPVSATRRQGIERLETALIERLPESEMLFDEDQITDRTDRFFISEIIREKIMLFLDKELPYSMAVEIERSERPDESTWLIHALIWVERESQKGIVIGKGGSMLKRIGISARRELESSFNVHIDLRLWVKVKTGWADDERALKSLGIDTDAYA